MVVTPKSQFRNVGGLFLNIYACNIAVILDFTLSFQSHVKSFTNTAFFHLQNLSKLRPSLSGSLADTLISAFNISRLDDCNGVLSGMLSNALDWPQ